MIAFSRCAVVAVAAFHFSLAANVAFAAAADQLAVRWSDLQPLLNGRQISAQLKDGATVEGRYSSLQSDALSIRVTKTSSPAKHPKGATRLARPDLAQITIKRQLGWKGRTIGLITGGAIAALIFGVLNAQMNNEGGWSSTGAGVAAAGGGAAIGISYLVGWLLDTVGSRPEQVVRILPDEAGR